jgi:hypothetical protein
VAQRRGTTLAASVERSRTRNISLALGAVGIIALGVAVLSQPADARQKAKKAALTPPVVDIDNGEPMMLVVSLGDQKIDVYRGTELVTTSGVSTGTKANPTMVGAFSILEKKRHHFSNLYDSAPMPYMNRVTWSGTALHEGILPGYPASHGCIRLHRTFAPQLFKLTTVGDNVVISRGRPVPTPVEHPALFQPAPMPNAPKVAEEEAPRNTSATPISAVASSAPPPVLLVKAETGMPTTTDSGSNMPVTGVPAQPQEKPDTGRHENSGGDPDPNRAHAITRISDITGSIPMQPVASAPTSVPLAMAKVENATGAASQRATASETVAKLGSGVDAAAIIAAEPPSPAPLRMLITRRTQRDQIIGVQKIFASTGLLPEQNFDGTLGKATVRAIKEFQKANNLPVTGAFNDELAKKVYEKAGKGEPPAGHIFVRQELDDVFDAPVGFSNPDDPLGTHVYTALKFDRGAAKANWVVLDVENAKVPSPLDRLEIPDDVRQKISARLTPGSTLIVADRALNSAGLPKGGDFVVLTKDSPAPSIGEAGRSKPRMRRVVPDRRFERPTFQPFWGGRGGFFGPW